MNNTITSKELMDQMSSIKAKYRGMSEKDAGIYYAPYIPLKINGEIVINEGPKNCYE